jgi:hypothetical protein
MVFSVGSVHLPTLTASLEKMVSIDSTLRLAPNHHDEEKELEACAFSATIVQHSEKNHHDRD